MQTDTFVVLRIKFEQAMSMMSDDQLRDISLLAASKMTEPLINMAAQAKQPEVPIFNNTPKIPASGYRPGMKVKFMGKRGILHTARIETINKKTATVFSETDGRKWRVSFSLLNAA